MELKDTELYFAYGSNLFIKQIKKRCKSVVVEAVAYFPHFEMKFTRKSKKSGYVADMVHSPGQLVWGVIYSINKSDLLRLDRFEGIHSGAYIRRKVVTIELNGTERIAWAYFVKTKVPSRPPNEPYMRKILRGAKEHELPKYYIEFLKTIKTKKV